MSKPTMTQDAFLELTRAETWATIDVLVRRLDEAAFWDKAFLDTAVAEHKKAFVRRQIRQLKDGTGWPLFANVVEVDPISGDETHIYKQEQIFDRDDYVQVVTYHRRRAEHHERMAQGYAERARVRFSMQVPLWIGEVGALAD